MSLSPSALSIKHKNGIAYNLCSSTNLVRHACHLMGIRDIRRYPGFHFNNEPSSRMPTCRTRRNPRPVVTRFIRESSRGEFGTSPHHRYDIIHLISVSSADQGLARREPFSCLAVAGVVHAVTAAGLTDYLKGIRGRTGAPAKPETRNRHRGTLHNLFATGSEFSPLDPLAVLLKEVSALTEDEISDFLESCKVQFDSFAIGDLLTQILQEANLSPEEISSRLEERRTTFLDERFYNVYLVRFVIGELIGHNHEGPEERKRYWAAIYTGDV